LGPDRAVVVWSWSSERLASPPKEDTDTQIRGTYLKIRFF
jgi:hypothetical protein